MHESPESGTADGGSDPVRVPLTTGSVFELLDRGREVRLSDDPPMPGEYVLFTSTVTLRRLEDGEFHVHTYTVCHDGSCASGSRDETLDRAAAQERVTRLLADGLA